MSSIGVISPSLANVITSAIETALLEMHIGLPARVIAFDATARTCDVELLQLKAFYQEDGSLLVVPMPPLRGVPVAFPGGGGFKIRWPLAIGDHVYLSFAERSLDDWKSMPPLGAPLLPSSPRKHDLSDAIAIAPLKPASAARPQLYPDALVLGTEDDSTAIVIRNGSIELSAGAPATSSAVLGEALIAYLSTCTVATPAGPQPLLPPPTAALLLNPKLKL